MIVENLPSIAKYPATPYWPWSPAIGRDDNVHTIPGRFVGQAVVVTEKLDGSNTLLHAGKVYGRSVSAPSEGKWMAMVKKHHAWKVTEPNVYLYGEDIYGVHSITYGPVEEQETFYAFALRDGNGVFAAFADVESYAKQRRHTRLFRSFLRDTSGQSPRSARSWSMPTASRRCSAASGRVW